MFARLLLLFTLVPLAELALLVWLGRNMGLVSTIALVITTGALGAYLARREGLRAWHRVRSETRAGRLPAEGLLDGLLVLIAGAVLLTPGLITDVIGFSLLLPGLRRAVGRWIGRGLGKRFHAGRVRTAPGQGPVIVVDSVRTVDPVRTAETEAASGPRLSSSASRPDVSD